jgi:hypothetical protein
MCAQDGDFGNFERLSLRTAVASCSGFAPSDPPLYGLTVHSGPLQERGRLGVLAGAAGRSSSCCRDPDRVASRAVSVFEQLEGHEEVVYFNDPSSGLRAIVAIHSTALGPALGGTRFLPALLSPVRASGPG